MLKGFKQFLLRGNVIDLAVAVVIGGAFGTVVTALVKDLLTPLIAAIVQVFDQRRDDGAERAANHHCHGKVDDVATDRKSVV